MALSKIKSFTGALRYRDFAVNRFSKSDVASFPWLNTPLPLSELLANARGGAAFGEELR
jgi:hypothetical protein